MKIVTVQQVVTVRVPTKTGRSIKTLKSNYRFSDGGLYRRPTVNDVDVDQMIRELSARTDNRGIARWVLDRLDDTSGTTRTSSSLVEDVKGVLASRSSDAPTVINAVPLPGVPQ